MATRARSPEGSTTDLRWRARMRRRSAGSTPLRSERSRYATESAPTTSGRSSCDGRRAGWRRAPPLRRQRPTVGPAPGPGVEAGGPGRRGPQPRRAHPADVQRRAGAGCAAGCAFSGACIGGALWRGWPGPSRTWQPSRRRPTKVVEKVPDAFMSALRAAALALSEHFQQQPLAVGALLDFHFGLQRFARLAEALGDHSLFEIRRGVGIGASEAESDDRSAQHVVLGVRNVAPAAFLNPRFKALHSITLFSATLSPPKLCDPAARPACGHVVDRRAAGVCRGASDRPGGPQAFDPIRDRDRSLGRLVGVIARQFATIPGTIWPSSAASSTWTRRPGCSHTGIRRSHSGARTVA